MNRNNPGPVYTHDLSFFFLPPVARQRHQRLHLREDADDGAALSDAQADASVQVRPGERGELLARTEMMV